MSTENTGEPRRIGGFNTVELTAGVIVLITGIYVVIESLSYPFGSLQNVGPAVFPMLLGIILAALGLGIVFEGRIATTISPKIPYRAILAICAGLAAFAFLIDRAGAFISIFALVFLSGLAEKPFRPVPLLGVVVGLCLFITVLVLGFRGIVNISLLPGA